MMRSYVATACAVAVLCGVTGVTAAQVQAQDEIALTRQMIDTGRQAIVAENLGLTDEQGKVFWPLYREYANERARLGDKMTALLERYAGAYKNMDDATAVSIIDEFLALQKEEVAFKSKWFDKIKKVLPGALAARFFQIDNKLDAYIKAVAADEVPLITGGKPATIVPKE